MQDTPQVVILDAAVLSLVDHLSRNGHAIRAPDVHANLSRSIGIGWNTAAVKQVRDSHGFAWILDCSDSFNGEMLYAVIRSGPGGVRQVVAVVEGDDIEALQRKNVALPTIEGLFGIPPDGEAQNAEPGSGRRTTDLMTAASRQPKAPADDPAAPVLVLLLSPLAKELPNDLPEQCIRTTQSKVREVVGELLDSGAKPDQIEIWSGVRKPKVQIAFE